MFTEMKLLDELIAAGWGSVPQTLIPPDWRTRKAPNENIREECLEDAVELDAPCVSQRAPSLPRSKQKRRERLDQEAAEMRKRYDGLTPARVKTLRPLGRAGPSIAPTGSPQQGEPVVPTPKNCLNCNDTGRIGRMRNQFCSCPIGRSLKPMYRSGKWHQREVGRMAIGGRG